MTGSLTVAVIGAGGRGTSNAGRVRRAGGRVVAVAEPIRDRRDRLAAEHGVPPELCFADWADLANRPRLADIALITTQDRDHAGPAIGLAGRGYHIICEKPMATTEPDAVAVVEAVRRAGVQYALLHPLRYTAYTSALVDVVRSGRIGRVVSVQHLEPVGWWHFAHSYVRGPWRREDESSPLLLAKSSHDLDWLLYVIGDHVERVASFGRLTHFRAQNAPEGAGERCVACDVEPRCPYSAKRLYLSRLGDPRWEHWPLGAVTTDTTEAGVLQALRTGPYGRCVYACDNTVVDHQVVALEFAGGVTATHTVTAFTAPGPRQTRIFGTDGCIDGDGVRLVVHDFGHPPDDVVTDTVVDRDVGPVSAHDDGDLAVVRALFAAVESGDGAAIRTGTAESLAAHRVVWAAERARVTGTVEPV